MLKRIEKQVKRGDRIITMGDGTKLQTTRLNTLDNDAATFIEKAAKYDRNDLFLMQNDDGRIGVYKVAKDENGNIAPFEPTRDLVVNLNTEGNEQTAKTFNVINPKTGQVVMKGVSKEQAEAARKKGYNVQ